MNTLDATYDVHPMALLTQGNAFKVLIACLLSLRAKDEVTIPISAELFQIADTPEKLAALPQAEIEHIIRRIGFYRNKARVIREAAQTLLDKFEGHVPKSLDTLLTIRGVGRKTANLVVALGFNQPAICVDVHVHRIVQRVGFLAHMKDPEATEMALREKIPPEYWQKINRVFVLHGQQCCKPIGPRCQQCPVEALCLKVL